MSETDKQEKDPQITEMDNFFSTSINDLGEYEFIKIFGYIPFKERLVLSRVCHKWKYCVDESFKSEKVLDSRLIVSNKLMALLIEKCFNVRHIDLRGITFYTLKDENDLIETIVVNCCQLKSIDFGAVSYLDEVFKRNANYFLQLKKIVSKYISGEALNCIIGSENLETIDVNGNHRLINVNFKSLGPKIRELHLNGSNVYQTYTIKDLCEGNGTKIETLSVDIKEEEVLSLICNNLKKLKELKLCLYSRDFDFKGFANLIDLKSLHIESNSFFKSEDFTNLIKSLKVTKIIELIVDSNSINRTAVTDGSLQELRMKCPFIEKLAIRGFNSLTGAGMYSISQMKNLKYLDLKHCENIDDNIIIVITSCPLRELILHCCKRISSDTVLAFIEKAKISPNDEFFLDISRTNVRKESLPLFEESPKNLQITDEFEDTICSAYDSEPDDYVDDYGGGVRDIDSDYGDSD